MLGVPLQVTLAFPSAAGADPNACSDLEVDAAGNGAACSESTQADWIDLYIPLLMAKEVVSGIFWTHFTDSSPHYFPHAGLIRENNSAKPALSRLAAYGPAFWPDRAAGSRQENEPEERT
jgi:hypothetical protein